MNEKLCKNCKTIHIPCGQGAEQCHCPGGNHFPQDPAPKEECCAGCITPASGASDETVSECSNPKCKYCHDPIPPTLDIERYIKDFELKGWEKMCRYDEEDLKNDAIMIDLKMAKSFLRHALMEYGDKEYERGRTRNALYIGARKDIEAEARNAALDDCLALIDKHDPAGKNANPHYWGKTLRTALQSLKQPQKK